MISIAYGALWLFVFSVPWERLIVLSGISIISKATGALALGMTLLVVVISARLRRWRGIHVAAFLFVAWASIGVMILHLQEIPAKLYTFIQLFMVMWMVWELATTASRIRGLLLAYVLGAYVAALETILLYRRAAGELRRFAAGGMDPNSLAMTLALGLPMAWYLGMTHPKSRVRWICRLYLPIGLFGIVLTGSRGGLITAMVALLIVPLAMTNLSPGQTGEHGCHAGHLRCTGRGLCAGHRDRTPFHHWRVGAGPEPRGPLPPLAGRYARVLPASSDGLRDVCIQAGHQSGNGAADPAGP